MPQRGLLHGSCLVLISLLYSVGCFAAVQANAPHMRRNTSVFTIPSVPDILAARPPVPSFCSTTPRTAHHIILSKHTTTHTLPSPSLSPSRGEKSRVMASVATSVCRNAARVVLSVRRPLVAPSRLVVPAEPTAGIRALSYAHDGGQGGAPWSGHGDDGEGYGVMGRTDRPRRRVVERRPGDW